MPSDVEVAVVEQRVATDDLELHDRVDLAAGRGGDHRALVVEELQTLPSSGVSPPHHSGLRSNVAPVAASNWVSFHGPVPSGVASSVVPVA